MVEGGAVPRGARTTCSEGTMTASARRRTAALGAVLLASTFAVASCSDGSSGASGSSSSLATASSSTSAPASSSSSASTTSTFNTQLANSCVASTRKLNALVRQWNAANQSKSTSKLDDAAKAMGTTATAMRGYGKSAGDKGFSDRADAVATALDGMKKNRDDKKSVLTGDYNSAASSLRSYCSKQLGVK